jgi:hypothetical protein
MLEIDKYKGIPYLRLLVYLYSFLDHQNDALRPILLIKQYLRIGGPVVIYKTCKLRLCF